MRGFKNYKNGRETIGLCCDCGLATKTNKMFIKQYEHTAFCLCRKCALKLGKEIVDVVEKDMLEDLKMQSNDLEQEGRP